MGCASIMLCYHLTLVTPLFSWPQLKCKYLHPNLWSPEHSVHPGTHQLSNTVRQATQAAEEKRYVETGDAPCSSLY